MIGHHVNANKAQEKMERKAQMTVMTAPEANTSGEVSLAFETNLDGCGLLTVNTEVNDAMRNYYLVDIRPFLVCSDVACQSQWYTSLVRRT